MNRMRSIEVRFVSEGVWKKHKAEIRKEKTSFGEYEYIFIKDDMMVPQRELIRIANEKNMPVFHRDYRIFPNGRSFIDFIKKS